MIKRIKYYTRLIRVLSYSKIVNLFWIYSSYYFTLLSKKTIHKGEPWSLSVETGTFCNLSCLECPSGQKQFTRPTGVLSFENFKIIIDKQKKYLIWLILYFQGEPFLNKDFFRMVSYANSQNIFTSTSTNGHFLNSENAEKTVKSGLDRIIISLDGLDQTTYEKYRVGGSFNQVIQGIENLVQAKKSLKSTHPLVIVQFIVFKTNEHQINLLNKLKQDLKADKIELKTAQIYSKDDKNSLIPEEAKYSRYLQAENGEWIIKKKVPNKCNRMWRASVITWDGKVVPCCFDKDATYQMGNLLDDSFKTIKNNQSYSNFRGTVFSDRSSIEICNNCTEGI